MESPRGRELRAAARLYRTESKRLDVVVARYPTFDAARFLGPFASLLGKNQAGYKAQIGAAAENLSSAATRLDALADEADATYTAQRLLEKLGDFGWGKG